jgi:hypothetical protein
MMISGVGVAAASARPAGPARPAVSGTEQFHLMTTSGTAKKASLIATGVFTAGGVDMVGNKVDTAVFSNGTFKINHPGKTTGKQHFDPKTCLLTASVTGKYTISGGTGSYAGISGSGTAVINILAVAARNSAGACSMKLPPVAWQQTITGTGPIKL